jgi:hypothetical protein
LTKLWTASIPTVLPSQWISAGHQTTYLSWTNQAAPQQTTPCCTIKEVENLERHCKAKVLAGGLTMIPKALDVHFGLRLAMCAMVITHNSSSMALHSAIYMSAWWVPPKGAPEDYGNYQANDLRNDRLL